MIIFVTLLVTLSVALLVFGVGALVVTGRSDLIRQRLFDVKLGGPLPRDRRSREETRKQLQSVVEDIGRRVASENPEKRETIRLRLLRAGFRRPNAVILFQGIRILLLLGLALGGGFLASLAGMSAVRVVLMALVAGSLGWYGLGFWLSRRIAHRQKTIERALPDTLDLLVVCVEAGLGLNQAFVRVAEEIEGMSAALSEELALINWEIRAGVARAEAIRNFGDRTDTPDTRALVGMLTQTDRFGTSIARALRVQADSLRTKRRQRAEEQAAKMTIKLVFPLVLFIFPAMFVVILAPSLMHIFDILTGVTG